MEVEFVLRPVREEDLPKVTELVGTISGGMTSLPDHPEYLARRIEDSLRAFDHRVRKPAGETYFFVLEELKSGGIVGTSGLLSRVGGFDPFYTYRIRKHVQTYEPLHIRNELKTLELVKNHKGPSETCSLFLHASYRSHGIGKLLSLPRFCFMKANPERFDEEIIAELRGYLDQEGHSPFWEAVGSKFFQRDYYTADVLSGIGEKDFIEALLPEFPIYINLLPFSAQAVIGKVHPHTEPAKSILTREGFKVTDEVDIFDAGPILRARREELKTWEETRTARIAGIHRTLEKPHDVLLTNLSLDFRAIRAEIDIKADCSVCLTPDAAKVLNVNESQQIQYLPLN
jgi:arginine N-succinyltransferase